MAGRILVLGVPIDRLSRAQAHARCAGALTGDRLFHVVTANPELVLRAFRDQALRQTIEHADLVVPDGTGLLFAARAQAEEFPERMTGIDLLFDLCRLAAEKSAGVYLLGGRRGVAVASAARLAAEIQGLRVTAFIAEHDVRDAPETPWEELQRLRPALLFVAYGAPAQERWIAAHRERLRRSGVRVAMGVGGSFDMLAGRFSRAPRWMRRAGLEWVWRLVLEPSRLPRVLRATVFFPVAVLGERFRVLR